MDLTIQVLVGNHQATINDCLESLIPLKSKIVIVDIGSNDDTLNICSQYPVDIRRYPFLRDLSLVRNMISEETNTSYQMYLHPWEKIVMHGTIQSESVYVRILQNGFVAKERRIWLTGSNRFVNPIFETLEHKNKFSFSDFVIKSEGGSYIDNSQILNQWIEEKPTSSKPYYYDSIISFASGRWERFASSADRFMFLHPKKDVSSMMIKYCYGMYHLLYSKNASKALEMVNQCLQVNPLMAEFWCLAGDVNYQLMNKFNLANELYENALVLGSRRPKHDIYPMEIDKYREYPNKMMINCGEILKSYF